MQTQVADTMPSEVRAALGVILCLCKEPSGALCAEVLGNPILVQWLMELVPVQSSDDLLITLGADTASCMAMLHGHTPTRVVILSAGRLARVLAPIRRNPLAIPVPPTGSAMRAAGYAINSRQAIQGAGSLVWAIGERACRLIRRPDLADRSRFAMQASLVAAPVSGRVGTLVIEEYRKSV